MQDRKETTLEKPKQNGPKVSASKATASGFISIIDKAGKLKAKLPITSIEVNEEKPNGN